MHLALVPLRARSFALVFLVREAFVRNHRSGLLVGALGVALYQGCGGSASERAALGAGGTGAHSASGGQNPGKGGKSSLGREPEATSASGMAAQAGAGEGGAEKNGEAGA